MVTEVESEAAKPSRWNFSIPPVVLPLLVALLLVAYLGSSGPAAYALGRKWISWDTYRTIYSPIDEAVWDTATHRLAKRYQNWWRDFGVRHQPAPLKGQGLRIGDRWVSLKSQESVRFIRPGDSEFARLGDAADETIVIADARAIAIGSTRIRVDGKTALSCMPKQWVQIESDDGRLTIVVDQVGSYRD